MKLLAIFLLILTSCDSEKYSFATYQTMLAPWSLRWGEEPYHMYCDTTRVLDTLVRRCIDTYSVCYYTSDSGVSCRKRNDGD